MDTYNTTWISTVSGTGTTWTFNIVKEIFKSSNLNVVPEKLYQYHKKYLRIYKDNALKDNDSRNHYVLPCHAILALPLIKSRCKVITNVRNPYDTCASRYEFMKCSLGEAIHNAAHVLMLNQHYSSLGPEKLFVLPFEDIDERPENLIERISKFLGMQIDKAAIGAIAKKYSRENIVKMISKNDEVLYDKMLKGQEISDDEIVENEAHKNGIGSHDLITGYQSRQISNRKSGEWRRAFSVDQIPEIVECLDEFATSLGYKSEKV